MNVVEQAFVQKSLHHFRYESEKIPVLQVAHCRELGKLTALSFLAWVIDHPEGVISLPTGKTPEMFIKMLAYYKQHWNDDEVQQELEQYGIKQSEFPDTTRLKFVQMDEFFLATSQQQNSFSSYVLKHYVTLLGIQKENCLLMNFASMRFDYDQAKKVFEHKQVDLSLLHRIACNEQELIEQQVLQQMDVVCREYEEKIKDWGGIGFFLGGIGPDGHIAFNMSGDSFESRTRLVKLNYPTAAAAAVNLGGIMHARDKVAMTIGLQTILHNPEVNIIIFAAGEAKAPVIAKTVQGPLDQAYPGSIFQQHPHARFFITTGAAKGLSDRFYENLQEYKYEIPDEKIDEIVINVALRKHKALHALTHDDFLQDVHASLVADHYQKIVAEVTMRLKRKLKKGLEVVAGKSIVHTAPHHDDVMLSYHAYAVRNLKQNRNFFAYMTSGFNSVSDEYIQSILQSLALELYKQLTVWLFKVGYAYVVEKFAQAYKEQDQATMKRCEQAIFLHYVRTVFACDDADSLWRKLRWLQDEYFPSKYHGQKDCKQVQQLKGCMRESEVDRMWHIDIGSIQDVAHVRSAFYNGNYFTPQPSMKGDVMPMLAYMRQTKPDIVTVALDPEGTGPDTHYKVLQLVARTLSLYNKQDLEVWGYRNVWHRFSFAEAHVIIPVSRQEIDHMEQIFLHCFSTQKEAAFPSIYYDGPFSSLIKQVQQEQWQQLKMLLGEAYFQEHEDLLVQEAKGCIFMKKMSLEKFLQEAEHAREIIE